MKSSKSSESFHRAKVAVFRRLEKGIESGLLRFPVPGGRAMLVGHEYHKGQYRPVAPSVTVKVVMYDGGEFTVTVTDVPLTGEWLERHEQELNRMREIQAAHDERLAREAEERVDQQKSMRRQCGDWIFDSIKIKSGVTGHKLSGIPLESSGFRGAGWEAREIRILMTDGTCRDVEPEGETFDAPEGAIGVAVLVFECLGYLDTEGDTWQQVYLRLIPE